MQPSLAAVCSRSALPSRRAGGRVHCVAQADVAQYIHDLKDGRVVTSDLRPKLHALMEAFSLVRR